jgi:hypothetical protein
MKYPVFILSFIILFLFGINVSATQGCLIDGAFYTTYIGMIRLAGNPEIIGDKPVYNNSGQLYPINYNGASFEVCNTVPVNRYGNGDPLRNGSLCFVMSNGTYTGYPQSGGVRVASTYPSRNGTLQNFTISCLVTPLPLDDYLPIYIIVLGAIGAVFIRKHLFNHALSSTN